ncbi:MAG: hypothetical protein M1839_008616 [Geoglossum umbratile]|nr:MAG: hypothetical protein M1839_008616 [Geoglossum umbratile]
MATPTTAADTELLHVLDLPQLYTKPPFSQLLSTLELVAVAPASWDGSATSNSDNGNSTTRGYLGAKGEDGPKVREEGLPAYLTGIVKSPLSWLAPPEREHIWETVSVRLSERAGRTAQPPFTRAFTIPSNGTGSGALTIRLHEPTLTADNLGLKTWAAAYLLARRLSSLPLPAPERVLELGAGTGLVGIAAAAVWGAPVHLTDLPAIVPNLRRNVEANGEVIGVAGGVATVGVLDWGDVGAPGDGGVTYPLILAADPIYSPLHPKLLVQAVARFLGKGPQSRLVVELPRREAYEPEIRELRERVEGVGLRVLEEGEESGFDDWGSGEVRCWWGVWGWVSGGD